MDSTLIVGTIGIAVVAIIYFVNKKITSLIEAQKPNAEILEMMKIIENSSEKDRKLVLDSMQRSSNALNSRLDEAARVISGLQRNLGEMSEIGRGMKDLQEFLKSPKLRGNVGEHILKELLGQMLPKQSFHLQYSFKSGEKVDAAITTAAGLVPIDSKFPMENFRKMMGVKSEEDKKLYEKEFEKDVRAHIGSIARKYILTEEGTIDYALMYIPSEAVYYEIVNNPNLFEYSGAQRVLPVSPTTFYAYLKAILMSFEGQKIEARAKEILSLLRAVQTDYRKVEDNLSVLQKHVNNAHNTMDSVISSFSQLGRKITRTGKLDDKSETVGLDS